MEALINKKIKLIASMKKIRAEVKNITQNINESRKKVFKVKPQVVEINMDQQFLDEKGIVYDLWINNRNLRRKFIFHDNKKYVLSFFPETYALIEKLKLNKKMSQQTIRRTNFKDTVDQLAQDIILEENDDDDDEKEDIQYGIDFTIPEN